MGRAAAAGLAVMCLVGGAAACAPAKRAQTIPMSQDFINKIMDMHNEERRLVGQPPNAPMQNMGVMRYSTRLAAKAVELGGGCKFEHSTWQCRKGVKNMKGDLFNDGGYVGENIAGLSNQGRPGWTDMQFVEALVETWTGEKKWWTHPRYAGTKGSCPSNMCGHYIQIITHDTIEVGCTINKCSSGYLAFSPSLSTVNIRCIYGQAPKWPNENPSQIGTGDCATNICGAYGRCMNGGKSTGHTCECMPGYKNNGPPTAACVKGNGNNGGNNGNGNGKDKCKDTTNPCSRHGTCTKDSGMSQGYRCSCSQGWAGDKCERLASTCSASTTCSGRGTCKADGTCQCQSGWKGAACADRAGCPNPNPCSNGGTCNPSGASYTCSCKGGWSGPTCTSKASSGSGNSPNTATEDLFINFRKKIDSERARYRMPKLIWTNDNVNDAKTESDKCRLHGTKSKAAHGQGVSEFPMCGAALQFPKWGEYMGGQFWGKALGNKNVRTAGCWVSKKCNSKCGSSAFFRVFTCTYTTFDNTNSVPNAEMTEADIQASSQWSEQTQGAQHNGAFLFAGAACVAVAAIVVALVVVRRRNAAATAEAEYTEMSETN